MKRRSNIAEKAELKRQKQLQKQLEKERKKAQAKQQKKARTAAAYRKKETLVQRNKRAAKKINLPILMQLLLIHYLPNSKMLDLYSKPIRKIWKIS